MIEFPLEPDKGKVTTLQHSLICVPMCARVALLPSESTLLA